jgi:PIN domain nuclease of toxin-antitoxin system
LKLLLDTHVFLWWWQGSSRLGSRLRRAIAGADMVHVSAASTWEMAIKIALGKLRFEGRISDAIESCQFEELSISVNHAEAVRALPQHHTDPFDRLLLVQAQLESLTFVTHDRALEPYGIPILWV